MNCPLNIINYLKTTLTPDATSTSQVLYSIYNALEIHLMDSKIDDRWCWAVTCFTGGCTRNDETGKSIKEQHFCINIYIEVRNIYLNSRSFIIRSTLPTIKRDLIAHVYIIYTNPTIVRARFIVVVVIVMSSSTVIQSDLTPRSVTVVVVW